MCKIGPYFCWCRHQDFVTLYHKMYSLFLPNNSLMIRDSADSALNW